MIHPFSPFKRAIKNVASEVRRNAEVSLHVMYTFNKLVETFNLCTILSWYTIYIQFHVSITKSRPFFDKFRV